MVKSLQTKVVNYKDLCSKKLINDLREAATCEVMPVCQLPCNRCPYVLKYIDTEKIKVKGLSSYTIKLEQIEDEQLLISITAPNIDKWLRKNNLPFLTRKALIMIRRVKRSNKIRHTFVNRRTRHTFVSRSRKLIKKALKIASLYMTFLHLFR